MDIFSFLSSDNIMQILNEGGWLAVGILVIVGFFIYTKIKKPSQKVNAKDHSTAAGRDVNINISNDDKRSNR